MAYEQKRRKGRVVPYGYKQNEHDGWLLDPIPSELDAVKEAAHFLKCNCAWRPVAQWLSKKTGRPITEIGLRIVIKRFNKENYVKREARKKELTPDTNARRIARQHFAAAAKAKAEKENKDAGAVSQGRAEAG